VTEGHSIGDVPTSPGGQVSLPVEEVGASIGDRYQVTRVLGKGGQGAVYECADLRLSRYTAVKRIGFLGVDAQERFLREAQAVAKLSHPNIVTLIDHDSDARGPYIVMERLDGQDFQRYVTRFGALSAETTHTIKVSSIAISSRPISFVSTMAISSLSILDWSVSRGCMGIPRLDMD